PVEAAPPVEAAVPSVDEADIDGRAAAAAGQTSSLLRRFRPGEDLDAQIAAYEREQAAAAGAEPVTAEPVTAEPVTAEPVTAEPVTAEVEPSGELAAAATADADDTAVVAGSPADLGVDVVEQPTWQIVAPESDPLVIPESSVGPAPTEPAPGVPPDATEPQWPARPEWPSQQPSAGLPFLANRGPGQAAGSLDSLWAESAREVVAPPTAASTRPTGGVAPCVSCGLSLSATARFCRRCGTRQG
ncbi:MAG: hypothetical protein OEV61_12995, partial [Chloroflexota bacterium]|nr:hypothetical protein [Chloroflexota bacterium]